MPDPGEPKIRIALILVRLVLDVLNGIFIVPYDIADFALPQHRLVSALKAPYQWVVAPVSALGGSLVIAQYSTLLTLL